MPSRARSTRLDGLDAARGLAVVSMLVAHLSPVGGPANITEYLTAPLFAVVIGVAMGLVLEDRRPPTGTFLRDNALRGLVLVVLGIGLQELYAQIVGVLPYLGLLIIVLAPIALLLHRMPVVTLGVAAGLAVVSPVVMERARDWAAANPEAPAMLEDLVRWLAAGSSYRVVSLLAMALGGLALATVLRRAGQVPAAWVVGGVLMGASLAAYLLGAASPDGSAAYSGSTAEIVGATLLACGTVVLSFACLQALRDLGAGRVADPLLATGRLALTAYTLQILWLALLAALRDNAPDDAWWILGSSLVVVVGACWALDRWWGTGPLEWVVHRLRAPVPGPPGRHAGTSEPTRRGGRT
ncbi:MAG TPA: acyltransferase family protein [Ornithinibacter sp.]|nr:acyltransferase family protein [Ornithinibacter sp.]